jgi:hypothetical protein
MIHPTPTKTLLTTTFESLVMQLSGLLARGTRLINRFVHADPTPETTMAFERELSDLLREVGRRIMAWPLNRLEPNADNEAPSRVSFEGHLYRRRQYPHVVGTLFGPVTLWRRLYEPLGRRGRSIHPLELRLGIEAGLATPALAERVGYWATDHTQHEVLDLVQGDHGVSWSCTSLRKLLGSLRAGMAPHREGAQVERVLGWIEQAHASKGRFRSTLSVGRDGIFVPLRRGVTQEGATATVSVLDRRGAWEPFIWGRCQNAVRRQSRISSVVCSKRFSLRLIVRTCVWPMSAMKAIIPAPITTRASKRWWTRAVPGVSWSGYGSSIFIMPVSTSSNWPTRSSARETRLNSGLRRCAMCSRPRPMGCRGC